jgi:hypothetical protein
MRPSNSLTLDFETERSTSSLLTHGNLGYLSDRRYSAANTTVIGFVFYNSNFTPLSDSAKQFITKLQSFKSLEPNWDSYGALPPSKESVDTAISFVAKTDKNLLPLYFVAPGPNGEVVLEFREGNKEASAYINADGTTELILNEGNNFFLEGTMEDNYKDLLHFING